MGYEALAVHPASGETTLPDREAEQQIGIVAAVSGFKLSCRLGRGAGLPGEPGPLVQVGSLVKIPTPKSTVLGFVNQLARPALSPAEAGRDIAVAEIDLVGELAGGSGTGRDRFSSGISAYPVLDAPVHLGSSQDLDAVYSRPGVAALPIGALYQDASVTAHLLPQEFLSKHSAIVGTTGSGKSCALALILRSLLGAHRNGHVIVIDSHGEYAGAFADIGERISTKDLQLPYWLFNYEEIVEILCSRDPASRSREAAILKDMVVAAKREYLAASGSTMLVTADTPVPYRLTNVMQRISEAMGKLDRPDDTSLPYLRLLNTIESLRRDERYGFMFDRLFVQDNLADIVSRIVRIPVCGRPITVLDISGIPSEVTDVVVSVLCRLVFDFALWSRYDESVPILLVCDEAHRYIPRDPGAGFEPTRRSISRIAKEGRKYGVSLCLVTQRPSEISEPVLTQCSTIFAFRLSHRQDQEFVRRMLPEDASGLLGTLPTLRQQEAIVVGEGVAHPMRIRFHDLASEFRPRSIATNFATAWESDHKDRKFVDTIIERWRQQSC